MNADQYYLARAGAVSGPYSSDGLLAIMRDGGWHADDRLCRAGTTTWHTLDAFPEFAPPAESAAPEIVCRHAGTMPVLPLACAEHPAAAAVGVCAACGRLGCERCLAYRHERCYCPQCRDRGAVLPAGSEDTPAAIAMGLLRRHPLAGILLLLLLFFAVNLLLMQRRWQHLPEAAQLQNAKAQEQFHRLVGITSANPSPIGPDQRQAWQELTLQLGYRLLDDTTLFAQQRIGIAAVCLQYALHDEDTEAMQALLPRLESEQWNSTAIIERVFFGACARALARHEYSAAADELRSLLEEGEFFYTADVRRAWRDDHTERFGIPPSLVVTPAQVCYYLGDCYWRWGKHARAREVWHQLTPDDPTARVWHARSVARMRG